MCPFITAVDYNRDQRLSSYETYQLSELWYFTKKKKNSKYAK